MSCYNYQKTIPLCKFWKITNGDLSNVHSSKFTSTVFLINSSIRNEAWIVILHPL
jgi:hypothetical protein